MLKLTQNYTCDGCGGTQEYSPKTQSLMCLFCSTEVAIAQSAEVKENDYLETLSTLQSEKTVEVKEVSCTKCAASFSLSAHIFSTHCPYCDTPAMIDCSQNLKPDGLLPFIITRKEAKEHFSKWVNSRWFAPTAFTKYFENHKILLGTYLPHWTYDTQTTTVYEGQRGDAYYVSVTRTVMEDGKSVQREVRERRIDWSYASGVVYVDFDDVIVPASPKVPVSLLDALGPWETKSAKAFDTQYIAGFESEEYTTKVDEGFSLAKGKMASSIRNKIHTDIGGDEQKITSQQTQYNAIGYKNILLPVWTAFFKWHDKEYQYAINAQTGKIVGGRPYSVTKIVFAVMGGAGGAGTVTYFEEIKEWITHLSFMM